MDQRQTKTEIQIFDKLYTSVKQAADIEQQFRNQTGMAEVSANKEANSRLANIAGNELPEYMGKMISGLGLHQQFQSLGRYVRSFTDAEYVVRNLRQQIISSIAGNETADAAISGLIKCSDIIAGNG